MMDSTYYIQYGSKTIYTTVTAEPNTVTDWISGVTNYFRKNRTVIFGLDIKWNPSWGTGITNPVSTLHICAGNRCLIVQLLHMYPIPRSLQRFLRNRRYVFAGVGIMRDAEKVEEEYGVEIGRVYDVREEARAVAEAGRLTSWPGLRELAWEVAGVAVDQNRRVQVGDWSGEVLSEEQIEYACLDAYASCRVGFVLYFNLGWPVTIV